MFHGLRIDYMVSLLLSVVALFSLAQLGGIPRPWIDSPKSIAAKRAAEQTEVLAMALGAPILPWTLSIADMVKRTRLL